MQVCYNKTVTINYHFFCMSKNKITVIGTGYVGLITGLCLASKGNDVICVDNNSTKVEQLRSGISPIFEQGIEVLLHTMIAKNRVHFSTDLQSAIDGSKVIFLCLPTPENEDGSADLSYILQMASSLASCENINGKIIVNKSTVPVGTGDLVRKVFEANHRKVCVVSNPEFLREGKAIHDFMYPERVVIGSDSKKCLEVMKDLYLPFVKDKHQIICMDTKSSEMTKYVANSFLATKISFVNETANLCEKLGANIIDVVKGIGSDSRIGNKFLSPSVGWGGSCFPKDVVALISSSKQVEYNFEILDTVMRVNDKQKNLFINKIQQALGTTSLEGLNIAVWGLAFKSGTDDIRKSPAIEIIQKLIGLGAKIKAYDPQAMSNMSKFHPEFNMQLSASAEDCLSGSDILVILTEWSEFKKFDLNIIKKTLKTKIIIDGRNLFNSVLMKKNGLDYHSIGRM